MVNRGEMDPKFDIVTLSMDGTHNLIRKLKDKLGPGNTWSYKLKDSAYNVLVIFISMKLII